MSEETNLGMNVRPTILLIEEDDDARPGLTANLLKLGTAYWLQQA